MGGRTYRRLAGHPQEVGWTHDAIPYRHAIPCHLGQMPPWLKRQGKGRRKERKAFSCRDSLAPAGGRLAPLVPAPQAGRGRTAKACPRKSGSRQIFGLARELSYIVDEIVAGGLADQSAPLQLGQGAADVFARDAGHAGNVALPDLVQDDDAPRVRLLTEMFGKFQQGARDARLDAEEACRRHRLIGLAQARDEGSDEIAVDFRILAQAGEERFAADEAQFAVADGDHGGRSRPSIDNREFSDDRARAKDCQDPLVALRRGDRDLEQALFEPIASVGDVAGAEQHFSFGERLRFRIGEQAPGKLDRQVGKDAGEVALWQRTWRRKTFRCRSSLSCRHGDGTTVHKDSRNLNYSDSYHRRAPRRPS